MGFIPEYNADKSRRITDYDGAGGVGSMLSQLAHWSSVLTVLATSSPKIMHGCATIAFDVPLRLPRGSDRQIHQAGIEPLMVLRLLSSEHYHRCQSVNSGIRHVGTLSVRKPGLIWQSSKI